MPFCWPFWCGCPVEENTSFPGSFQELQAEYYNCPRYHVTGIAWLPFRVAEVAFRTVGLPQRVTSDIPGWSYSVDSDKTRIPSNIVLLQGQVTTILAWIYGMGNKKTRIPSNIVLLQGQATAILAWPYSMDRRKISTFLAGVILDIFAVRFWNWVHYEIGAATGICQDHLSMTPLGKRLIS